MSIPVPEPPPASSTRQLSDENGEWELVEPSPYFRLVYDVRAYICTFMDTESLLAVRLTHTSMARIEAATWTAIARAVKEARKEGRKTKARDIVVASAKLTAGVVLTGVGVAGALGAVIYGGAAGPNAAAAILRFITLPGAMLAADNVKNLKKVSAVQLADTQGIVNRERNWEAKDEFDFCERRRQATTEQLLRNASEFSESDNCDDSVDVCVAVERQRFDLIWRQWLPTSAAWDPPAFECPQLGIRSDRQTGRNDRSKILRG